MRQMAGSSNKKSYGMMIASLLIVGTIGVFRRYIPLSSSLLAFFRGLIGSISLILYVTLVKKRGWQKIEGKKLAGLVLNGAVLGINWILLFEAFKYTTIAKATLAYYMQPTIILLLSPLLFREKLTVKKLLCAAAALLGMVLVSGVIGADEAAQKDAQGILFGLGAACFYAGVIILNKKIEGVDAYQKTIVQLLSTAVVLVPYLLLRGEFAGIVFDGGLLLLVLIVGVIYTGVVYALYFGSMSGLRAQTISTLSYIDPVTAMIVSALILRERLSLISLIGAVLIIGSALISELEPAKNEASEP